MSEALSIEAILAAQDLAEEWVDVPEWGGRLKVRALSRAQHHAARAAATVKTAQPNGKYEDDIDNAKLDLALIVAGCIEPKFEMAHASLLAEKSTGAIQKVVSAVLRVSGMTEGAQKAAEKSDRPEPGAAA